MIKMQTILLDKPRDKFEEDLDNALEMVWAELDAENEKRMEEDKLIDQC